VLTLPEPQRKVLILAHYEQLPLAEVAAIVGIEVGNESVLGYPTIIGRIEYFKTRLKLWMAPNSAASRLRATVERQQPDGSWTMVIEKKALEVTVRQYQ
jgi:hypothetical protein